MAIMSQEVQELFMSEPTIVLATANEQGQPNANILGLKTVVDDETVYVSDQFFNKTLANLKVNSKVAIVFGGRNGAYQLYGTARYINEGPEFEERKAWADDFFAQLGMPVHAKGGAFIHVDAVYQGASGPQAGAQLA